MDARSCGVERVVVLGRAARWPSVRAPNVERVVLSADSHVHTEWSWDAPQGSMRASCERALQLGLPAIAFTEHVDHTVWRADLDQVGPDHPVALLAVGGQVHPPRFDAAGYLSAIAHCRERFPDLSILSGLEVGEPHRQPRKWQGFWVGATSTVSSARCTASPRGMASRNQASSSRIALPPRSCAATWPRSRCWCRPTSRSRCSPTLTTPFAAGLPGRESSIPQTSKRSSVTCCGWPPTLGVRSRSTRGFRCTRRL